MEDSVRKASEYAPCTERKASATREGKSPFARAREKVKDDLAVVGALEDGTFSLESRANLGGVDEIPVVSDGDGAVGIVHGQRLGVLQNRIAGGRVTHVTDGRGARQLAQTIFGEDLADVAHLAHPVQLLAVTGNDASRFLPPVLERVQSEIGELRRLGVAKDSDYATHGRANRITFVTSCTPRV
jgi:hypothetical protein